MSLNSISQSQRLKTEICRKMQSTLTDCLGGSNGSDSQKNTFCHLTNNI